MLCTSNCPHQRTYNSPILIIAKRAKHDCSPNKNRTRESHTLHHIIADRPWKSDKSRCALPWVLAKAIPCFKAGNLRTSARGLKTEPTWVIPCKKADNLRISARARKLMTTWVIPCQNTGNLRTSARARKLAPITHQRAYFRPTMWTIPA